MNHKHLILLLSIFLTQHLYAQKLRYEFSYDLIADNREYFTQYATPQTILGARADLQGGFQFDSTQSVYCGLSYFYEFGYKLDAYAPVLDLYYHFSNKYFDVLLGSFPRKDLLNYPLVMLTDSLEYYRPNIQGGMLEFHRNWISQKVWIDWTSRQTETQRETFLTGVTGKIKFRSFYIEDHFHYWHRAGMANDSIRDIRDNNTFSVSLGADLKQLIPLDTISFSAGLVTSSDKIRPAVPYESKGLLAKLTCRYKRIGVDVIYYYGDAPSIEYGDRIYTSKNYLRGDIIYMPFNSKYVKSKIALGLHLVDGELLYSQQILVYVKINNKQH